MTENYPQIHLYIMTKSKWDSIFAMIPWLEDIEKIDPTEMYTDKGGARTRPLKYVEYKSASVQLMGKIFKILQPFDWENWEEGINILKEQFFTDLDLQTTCKLLTIILYYKESTGKLSSLGIPCRAQDLEDGRVLKLLKQLKINVEQELKKECEKYHAYYPQDTQFTRYSRLLHSKWCEKNGYPIEQSEKGCFLGNFGDADYAKNGKVNFLTKNIRNLVIEELNNAKEPKGLIQEDGIWTNLLSSETFRLNLFGELRLNLTLATSFFQNIFRIKLGNFRKISGKKIDKVISVLFDYSPYRENKNFTGDQATFDVFVEYMSEGKKCFIGIEVKYAETLREEADKVETTYQKHETEYLQFATADIFKQECIENLRRAPLFEIWRYHLLSISLLKNNLYEDGFFLFLFPRGNDECHKSVWQYTEQLRLQFSDWEDERGFYWRALDDFTENLHNVVNQEWTKQLRERYFGT